MAKEFTGVKLYIDWTQASTRANITTGAKTGEVEGENLAVSMGKIAKWFADIENTGLFSNTTELTDTTYSFSSGTDGSFSVTEEGGSAQTVRVLPATTTSDETKVLMINSSGVPAWTSQAWITNTVNDLTNYYRKYNSSTDTDKTVTTYSASEIDNLVAPKLAIEVVQALPTTNISKTTIYLKPVSGTGTTNNVYEEWVYINDGTADKWEKIGVQEIDLAGYLKASNVQSGSANGTIKVKGEGDNSFTDVAVTGWNDAAEKDVATAIVASGQDANITSDDELPTVKAVYDFISNIDTGVSSVSGTQDQIDVDQTTGAVTVSLADILTFDNNDPTESVGPSADVTGTNDTTISVPSFTVDTTGRITAVGEQTFTAKDEKVAQTAITDGENKYYPILFGNTGASSVSNGAITSATEDSAGTKKTGRMYVKVSDTGVTTLHADVFSGLAATQATSTSDNTLASTEFVHNVANDLLANKLVEGSGIDLAYDTTNKTTTVSIDNTVTADTTGAFAKLTYNAQGLITGATAVAASDVKDLTGINFGTTDGTAAGTNGMVPAPAAADAGKFLSAGGWAALPTGTTSAAGIVQLQDSIDSSTTTALTPNAVNAANYASYDDTGVVIRCVE